MDKKRIMMISAMVVALVLLVLKLGPLFMPRSWRAKRMAQKTGQPTAEKKVEKSASDPAPAAEAPGIEPETTAEAPRPDSAVEINPEFLDRAIEKLRALKSSSSSKDFPEINENSTLFGIIVVDNEAEEEKKPPLEILVSGILFDRERPLAIINGGIYSEGDEFEGMKILNILRNSIILSGGQEDFNITLGERIGG